MAQTKLQLQGRGMSLPGDGSFPQKVNVRSDLGMPSRWTHGESGQQGESFLAGSLAVASLAVSTSGSFLRSSPSAGINTSKTNPTAL